MNLRTGNCNMHAYDDSDDIGKGFVYSTASAIWMICKNHFYFAKYSDLRGIFCPRRIFHLHGTASVIAFIC